jgi:hypothetical protein
MVAKKSEIRVSNLRDQDQSEFEDLSKTTPAERLQMMWQLTLDAWAFKGEPITDQRLPRHIIHVRKLDTSKSA